MLWRIRIFNNPLMLGAAGELPPRGKIYLQSFIEGQPMYVPPWPNGQGVGLLIRRLRVRVPQGVSLVGIAHDLIFA